MPSQWMGLQWFDAGSSQVLTSAQIESQMSKSASLASEYQQATKLHAQGHIEDAAKHYRRAAEVCMGQMTTLTVSKLDPHDPLSRYGLGVTFAAMGDYENSKRLLSDALKLQPGDPMILCSLGALMHRMGDLDAASAKFRSCIREDPSVAEAHANLALCLKQQVGSTGDSDLR